MARIVVDAMGSDEHPGPDVEGAILAAREYGVEIIFVGDEAKIKPVLEKQNTQGLKVRVVHAPEMLTMEDKGEALVLKARAKDAQNSMAVIFGSNRKVSTKVQRSGLPFRALKSKELP